MGAVHIKDEARVGSEAKFRLEPSVYLQKLYEGGTPDLGWMNQMGEWGVRAKPGNLGLRLKDIQIGSYGVIPEHGGAHRSMAPRGAVISDELPSLGFTINEKAEKIEISGTRVVLTNAFTRRMATYQNGVEAT